MTAGIGVEGKIIEFACELRKAGLNVTLSESVDAVLACEHLETFDLGRFKFALRSTMVKSESDFAVFESTFDNFFLGSGIFSFEHEMDGDDTEIEKPDEFIIEIRRLLTHALVGDDASALRYAAKMLALYAHNGASGAMGQGKSVSLWRGPAYYVFRALDVINFREIVSSLQVELTKGKQGGVKPVQMRLEELEANAKRFEKELFKEVKKRIARRVPGDENSARASVDKPAVRIDEVEFVGARADQIEEMRRILVGISRTLAARIDRKYKKGRGAKVDFRNTIRHSLSYGGAPFELKFKKRKRSRPDLFVLCDISGSVRNFSSFTLQLVFSLQAQFRSVRSFVFIDRIDEVTELFRLCDASEAIERAYRESRVVDGDGHSDVGRALEQFVDQFSDEISPRSSVLILSDARNNSKDPRLGAMERLRDKTDRIYWLNPEPENRWDTGDSLVSEYAPYCRSVKECRNLKQLAEFVFHL